MITRYRHLVIEHPKAAETRGLADVQALFDSPLPTEFAEFLLAAAGGVMRYDLPVGPTKKRQSVLECHLVLGLGLEHFDYDYGRARYMRTTPVTIVGCTQLAREEGAKANYLAFAAHPSVRYLFYDLPPEGSGKIWASNDCQRFKLVADSFEDYLQRLTLNHQRQLEWLQRAAENLQRSCSAARGCEWLDAAIPDWRTRWEVPADVVAQLEGRTDNS